ncbi:hypothetical protein ACTA71_008303 [Dictyostelium dimigraforme]
MDKYYRVPRTYDNDTEANEVRIGGVHSQVSSSIEYGLNLFNKPHDSIIVKAIGSKMISKAIFTAEIIKLRVPGLHQITEIGTTEIVTQYMPKEEGLDKVEISKKSAFIKITLSKTPLDTTNPGYQAPLPESETQKKPIRPRDYSPRRSFRGGRGGFRGGRGGFRGGSSISRRGGRGGFRGNSHPMDNTAASTTTTTTTTPPTTISPTSTTTTTTGPVEQQQQEQQPLDSGFRGRGRGGGFRGRGRGRGGFGGNGRGRGGFRGRGRGGFRGGAPLNSYQEPESSSPIINTTNTTSPTSPTTTATTTTTTATTESNDFRPRRGRGGFRARGGFRVRGGNGSSSNSPSQSPTTPTSVTSPTPK